MRISLLQKFILQECYNRSGLRAERTGLVKFYSGQKAPKKELRAKIITRSMESLIDKEFLVGYGVRTSHKWFIKEIRLTNKGVKIARKLLGEQLKLL